MLPEIFFCSIKDSYHRLRGFNEVYRVAKIHIDGNFCLKAFASERAALDIGHPVYHVGRGTFMLRQVSTGTDPEKRRGATAAGRAT